jgi:DNA-binding transcriptional ArsR family regulator
MPAHEPVPIEVIAAFHHPARRRIMDYLSLDSPATVGGIATALGLQVGSVSHHLKTLEQAGCVEPDPDASTDKRQSWWRPVSRSLSWSTDDFAGAERMLAEAAEVENFQHQLRRIIEWFGMREDYGPAWSGAAFSTDRLTRADPVQLAELGRRLDALVGDWEQGCRANTSPDQVPVFVVARGVPARP